MTHHWIPEVALPLRLEEHKQHVGDGTAVSLQCAS